MAREPREISLSPVNNDRQSERERKLRLACEAFQEFSVQCFWSWNENAEITEETIPLIVEGLRHYGGHRGYRIADELCR